LNFKFPVKKESFGLCLKTTAAAHLILALLFMITAKQGINISRRVIEKQAVAAA
jgi:predicted secreted protein